MCVVVGTSIVYFGFFEPSEGSLSTCALNLFGLTFEFGKCRSYASRTLRSSDEFSDASDFASSSEAHQDPPVLGSTVRTASHFRKLIVNPIPVGTLGLVV